jgi:hypothetical protein
LPGRARSLTPSIAYEAARRIGFSLSTLYRHMLGGRAAVAKSAKIVRCLMVLPDRVLGTVGDQFALVAAPFRCVSSPPAVPATTNQPLSPSHCHPDRPGAALRQPCCHHGEDDPWSVQVIGSIECRPTIITLWQPVV